MVLQEQQLANSRWGSEPSSRVATERFTSREFARLERDRLWSRVWQMACRLEEIPNVGDFLEYEICDRSYLIVRSGAEAVQAFVNVCLHRGTQLKKGCGSAEQLTCPFHAWTWNLDGTIRRVTCPEDFPDVTPEELSLPECQVGIWGGFVFINPDASAEPFEDFIAPLVAEIAPYRPELHRLQNYRRAIVPANWKLALEAFEETYHVPATHPQTMGFINDFDTAYDLLGDHSRMIVPMGEPSRPVADLYTTQDSIRGVIQDVFDVGVLGADQRSALEGALEMEFPDDLSPTQFLTTMTKMMLGDRLPDLQDGQWAQNWQYTVFPNTVINCVPGHMLVHRARPNGDGPDTCIFEFIMLNYYADWEEIPVVEVEVIEDPIAYTAWGLAVVQDMANLPRIQAGMHGTDFIRFSGYQESRLTNRHRALDTYLARP